LQGFLLFIGIEVILITVTATGAFHMNFLQCLAVLVLYPVNIIRTKLFSDISP
jgi:hypothetical protein